MTPPPLAIVQARIGSTRLKNKMLLDLGGRPLVWWAWKASVDAFGADNVVCAIPQSLDNEPLVQAIVGFGGNVYRSGVPESDVLGRFHDCAHHFRWHPDSVIVRVTPDDPFKVPAMMRRVAAGERLPVELGGEAFTLDMLDQAHYAWLDLTHNHEQKLHEREHFTHAIFAGLPLAPPPPPGVWTVDTAEDLEAARARVTFFPTRETKAYANDGLVFLAGALT